MGQQVFTANGTFTATVAGVHTFAAYGCGQNGIGGTFSAGGDGGAGADYCSATATLAIGDTINITVGTNGLPTGEDSKAVNNATLATIVLARGGGSGSTNVGSVQNAGGAGGTASSDAGGGGGGAAGPTGTGGAGGNASGGTPGTGGAADGGDAGAGGAGGASGSTGSDGSLRGGAGGGGGAGLMLPAGGAGKAGEVVVTWTDATTGGDMLTLLLST